jgi:hypothetical protein
MSSYTPSFDAFAYSFAPLPAACSREVSRAYKSSIGTAFDTAASGRHTPHALQALVQLVLEYVHSLKSKYATLRDSRTQQVGTRDRDSEHLLLQQELALLHEIIDIQHDMRELQCQYAANDVVERSIQAICKALASFQ